MAQYVYCNQKSSHHRMDVRVCLARCPEKEDCPDLAKLDQSEAAVPPADSRETQPPLASAA